MKRALIWDLPVRLFHWAFAGTFLAAFAIANLTDDEGAAFGVHMLLGIVAGFLVLLRIGWGLVGSRPARLSELPLSPAALVAYLGNAVNGGGKRHAGHNPGSAWAMVAMFAIVAGLGVSGIGMSYGLEVFEEVHELLAWSMIVVVGAHLAGLAWHTVRHHEPIALSMVTGRKDAPAEAALPDARPLAGGAFAAIAAGFALALFGTWDPATGTVGLLGGLRLGEAEHEEDEGVWKMRGGEDEDDD